MTAGNKRYHRRAGRPRQPRNKKREFRPDHYERPDLDPGLRQLFRKIGVPAEGPFTPDPFQTEALSLIGERDVLVSAPTGAGKTWIAVQAIHQYLSRDMRVWYASPLKALSNSIYRELCGEFGSSYCGIVTGDRKENTDAPVIVGTTEILRNELYDAMHHGTSLGTDLVILDEAHYLSDPDRGVVWEEVLIYLPSRIRLLLLSATVSNGDEVCAWLESIRGVPNRVVLSVDRPVPLEALFLFPDGRLVPLGQGRRLSPRVKKFTDSREGRRAGRRGKTEFGNLIRCLRKFNLLPTIFFLKSRAECDRALMDCPRVKVRSDDAIRMERTLRAFLKEYPHLEGHRQLKALMASRVGSHHGGQLPYWKVLVEEMMNRGHLEAIFSTSTVAAGVNFPARSVVLVQSDRYNGREFVDLTATELHQMIGRAGRRGKDQIGFVLVIPGRHQDPGLIHALKSASPEPILSRIHINFSMTLNLLLSHTPPEVRDLLSRSFAAFQERGSGGGAGKRLETLRTELKQLLHSALCDPDDPFEVMENIRKREELQKERRSQRRAKKTSKWIPYLSNGKIFLHKNGGIYAILEVSDKDETSPSITACRIKSRRGYRKRPPRPVTVAPGEIRVVYLQQVDLSGSLSSGERAQRLAAVSTDDLSPVVLPDGDSGGGARDGGLDLPCEDCVHLKMCQGKKKGALAAILAESRSLASAMEGTGDGLWLSFRRHLRFLKETGFVDSGDRLTPDGRWASKLRLDQPLLIAEAIRKGAFSGISPDILAGILAPFVWDRDQEVELKMDRIRNLDSLEKAFGRVLEAIEPIRKLKRERGFGDPPLSFGPAAVLFLWARGIPWDTLLEGVSITEGDVASLVMRTADHLRQISSLAETHPGLALGAASAVELILREPVYIA